MSKSNQASAKKERNKSIRWVVLVFLITILVSGVITFASDEIMLSVDSIVLAFVILFVIIFVGIVFDVIGVAVTSAEEKPFHSMAARKVKGSQEAIRLLRNAERVSSICNDVVGDICGVVSGAASATIAAKVIIGMGDPSADAWVSLLMSALAAGLTVGGKAVGKTFAINSSTKIVHLVGKLIWGVRNFPKCLFKDKKES